MKLKIDNKTYQVSTNLGTAYEIEKNTGKKILDVGQDVDTMDLDDILEILYIGFKRENKDISFDEFKGLIFEADDFGVVEIRRELVIMMTLLVSKDKTEEKIREEFAERQKKALEKALEEADKDIDEKIKDAKSKNE